MKYFLSSHVTSHVTQCRYWGKSRKPDISKVISSSFNECEFSLSPFRVLPKINSLKRKKATVWTNSVARFVHWRADNFIKLTRFICWIEDKLKANPRACKKNNSKIFGCHSTFIVIWRQSDQTTVWRSCFSSLFFFKKTKINWTKKKSHLKIINNLFPFES